MPKTRLAIALFILAAAFGPMYTAPGYSAAANLISELAAQNTPRNDLMAGAFVVLGIAVAIDGLALRRSSPLPFVAFGVFFGLAGLFGHRPFVAGVRYSSLADTAHSVLASLCGVALTVGFVWQVAVARSKAYRLLPAAPAVACVGLPLLMLAPPAYQGAVQRVMYLAVFGWLWKYYARSAPARAHIDARRRTRPPQREGS
jgi:hypothetical protein